MAKTKSTKRALLMSALSLLMCVSMLIGSTYAWFTDSVTSSVNTIQAGTLQVDIIDANGASLEGKTLAFEDKDSSTLWEPGCTYKLQPVRVKNAGTLALKYSLVINGLTGDAKLLEAIEWTVTLGGQEVSLTGFTGELKANETSEELVITGHMKEEAGNDYQGLTIDNISITVNATQLTYEADSFDNMYDEAANATMVSNADELVAAIAAGGEVALTEDIELTSKLAITKNTVIYGLGNTLTYTGSEDRAIEISNNADYNVDLTIKDLTVVASCQRGINYNDNGTLTLDNVTLEGSTTYGINLPGKSIGATVNINGGSYTSYIALNVWGANSVITATDVDFITVDNNDTEGAATIKLNNDGTNSAEATVVTVDGGSITITGSNTNGSYAVENNTVTGVVNISDSTTVNGAIKETVSVVRFEGSDNYASHSSLQSSVDYVEVYTNGYIVLLKDITIDSLEVNGDVTIVTDGHTLTVGTYTGSGTLTVDGMVVYGN